MSQDDPMDDPRIDDPRLTAHAMGEAEGPLTPEEQAEVEAIRATAETLKAGFAATPMPTLDPAHRAAILQGLSATPRGLSPVPSGSEGRGTVPGSVVRLSEYSGLGALAATLLLVIGLGIAGATGGGDRGSSGLANVYVRSFSAPNDSGGFWDVDPGDLERLAMHQNTNADFAAPGGAAGPSVEGRISVGRSGIGEFGSFLAMNGDKAVGRGPGFGGGGGGGGHGYGLDAGARGNGPRRGKDKNWPFYFEGAKEEDVRRGLRRVTNGLDMDYRGRSENLSPELARRLSAIGGARPDGRAAAELPKNLTLTNGQGGLSDMADGGGGVPDADGVISGIQDFPAGDDPSATESFLAIVENPWIRPYGEAALSTFSIDVDTAGYSIVRRCLLEQNRLPPPGALRVEELVNYFPYAYEGPVGADPFAVHVDAAACPWAPTHRLVRIALKGREIEEALRPAANLVFLLDVSGSMAQPNKLPLVQKSIELLTERLTARDRVAMVVYAGSSGLVLPSTPAGDHAAILEALGRLQAGGSTNGGAGIELAYKVAAENFVPGGINRVVLATDGDFNVGVSDPSTLVKMVEEKAKGGVFLTALGFGMDNLKDSTLEQLADRGNGNYGYIDNLAEARKVLVEQGMSTLHCIAKDVKIQVEFNPAKVAGYRLLGYENRMLAAQDFADDAKDAGEIGAGHTVTALYEVVPAGVEVPGAPVDELRYQRPGAFSGNAETLVVKLRWKEPEGTVSTPREFPFVDGGLSFESGSDDFRFAAAVAAFGMVLRDSKCAGSANLDLIREIAAGALGADAGGYRAEFVTLVEKAKALKR